MSQPKTKTGLTCSCIGFLLMLCLFPVIIGGYLVATGGIDKATVVQANGVVKDKYLQSYGSYDAHADVFYVVVDKEDGSREIFQNHDSVAFGKFNSAYLQQNLIVGKRYQFTVCGFRIGDLYFRNIIEAKPAL